MTKVEEHIKTLIASAATAKESGDAMRFAQAAQNAGGAWCALRSWPDSEPSEAQIKHMVDRFLGWRLPENFRPDNGISFKQVIYEGMAPENQAAHWPVGTNLFDYDQAEAMVRHMLVAGQPNA